MLCFGLLNLLEKSFYCHIVASTDGKYQIHLAERKIHCCPKYQILSAFELVSRKLFIVTLLLLLLVATSQMGEAGFKLQLLP